MNNKTLYIGCDVSTSENYVCGILSDDSKVFSTPFENNIEGAEKMLDVIANTMSKYELENIFFAVESTSNYHFHILNFMASAECLKKYDLTLFQLNANLVNKFKKIQPKTSKTDKYDAYVIANRLRFGNLPEPFAAFNEYESLKRLTRTRFHIIKSLESEYNYFLSQLYLKFSEYKKLPFSNTFGTTSISLLTDFEVEDLVQMPEEELIDFLIDKSRDRFTDPEDYAAQIKKLARNCYRVNKRVSDAISTILKISLQTIKGLKDALKSINKAIESELEQFDQTLTSIPGIGVIYAACVIAEIGNPNRFANDGKVAKFAGLTWNQYESGSYSSDETPLNKYGNTYLRYYLIQAANSVKNHCPEFQSYYCKKYSEATKHHHKRALVLTARKMLRTLFKLLQSKVLYDSSKCTFATGGDL